MSAKLKSINSVHIYVQICEHRVQHNGDCIFCNPVAAVGKLIEVQWGWEVGLHMCQDQLLKALQNNGCECFGL